MFPEPGQRLWQFLHEPLNIKGMETAADLERAPVEGISRELLKEFDNEVREDRVRQLIGFMVRQIMEARGFQLHTQNAVVRFGNVFSRASRYRRVE